jgi:hypothetical protein
MLGINQGGTFWASGRCIESSAGAKFWLRVGFPVTQGGHERSRFPGTERRAGESPFAYILTPARAPRLRAPLLAWHFFDHVNWKFRSRLIHAATNRQQQVDL